MSILIVVPDGVGIRNYLFTDIIPLLVKAKKKIVIYHALDSKALEEIKEIHNIDFDSYKIPKYKESLKEKFYRESICFARLKYNVKLVNNITILKNWNFNKKGKQKYFYKLVQIFGTFLSKDYNKILELEKKYDTISNSNLKTELLFLKKINPESVFCTHQRAINAIPVFKAAKALKIKTNGVVYSWDNIPKARLSVKTDKYFVWSSYMKEEFQKFYPEINKEKIIVTGTPQFEFYNKKNNILTKEAFFKQNSLDLNKKTICFSGDDELTSPYDPIYLKDLCEEILNNGYADKLQILFRRSPVDLTGRYNDILEKYKDIVIFLEPLWSNDTKHWTTLYPYYEDIKMLTNICAHSDLVINLGSTMAHDFAFFNKPCAYLNYDTIKDINWSVKTIYKFQHFKSMPTKESVYWINKKEDFIPVIVNAIGNKKCLGKDWLKVVNLDYKNIAENIVNNLINK